MSPSNASNKEVTWLSSNNAVATVAGGLVTPLAVGSTIITATTVDGGYKATCEVTVSAEKTYVLATDKDFSGEKNGAFRYIGTEKYVEIPHVIKGVPVTSYNRMFYETSVEGVKSTNTNVTTMDYMFYKSKADLLDLSSFDTSNVTTMACMFHSSKIKALDLRGIDTSNVTNMYAMFHKSDASSLDLSSFNTSKVESMKEMFYDSQAKTLDLSSFDTSNVVNMESMFRGSKAISLDISSFDTSSVTTMKDMFRASEANPLDLSKFDTSSVTTMESMFSVSKASSLDLSSFDTSNVVNMQSMFWDSWAITLDLTSFDTSNVTDMRYMFVNSRAKSLDLSNFNTSKITYMNHMFQYSKATSLDLSSFDTSNVISMQYMFNDSQATTLDLSSFDTSKVTDMIGMFKGSQATTGYARTQADADKFNGGSDKPAELNFVVKDAPTVPVSNITVTGDRPVIWKTLQMGVVVGPDNASNKKVTWSVTDGTGSATIDEEGLLTATEVGTVTVKALAQDGSGTQNTKIITITETELEAVKLNAKSELTTALATYIQTDYEAADWATLKGYKTDGDSAIDGASDIAAVTSAKEAAINGMAGVNKKQAAPASLEGVAPTSVANNDGKITGTTTEMEYKLSSESDWTKVTATEVTGLAAGTYNVRYAAKTGYNAGASADVIVPEYTASTDANLSDLTVDGTTITGFDASTITYNVELPIGTINVPAVGATANNIKATIEISQASTVTDSATIVVTAEDGTTTKTYKINFTVAELVTENGFVFDKSTGTITNYTGESKDVIIPSTIEEVNVIAIGARAFDKKELASVTIPDTVVTIGARAFALNSSLTNLVIPNNVKTISNDAFNSCWGVKSLTLGDSIETIGNSAFYDCNLASLTLGNSVKTIGKEAFLKNKLTEVTIPISVESLGEDAFLLNGENKNSDNITTTSPDFVGTWKVELEDEKYVWKKQS